MLAKIVSASLNWLIRMLLCSWKGHKRGKSAGEKDGKRLFKCPRCKRTTEYSVKAAA